MDSGSTSPLFFSRGLKFGLERMTEWSKYEIVGGQKGGGIREKKQLRCGLLFTAKMTGANTGVLFFFNLHSMVKGNTLASFLVPANFLLSHFLLLLQLLCMQEFMPSSYALFLLTPLVGVGLGRSTPRLNSDWPTHST